MIDKIGKKLKNLLIYSTHDGQTLKIAKVIAQDLSGDTQVVSLEDAFSLDLADYDKVLIGASIRYGHFNKQLYRFIEANKEVLMAKQAAFYSVNLTARKEGKDTPEGSSYIQKFLQKSNWQPSMIGVFAGALYYPRYKFVDRMMIKLIMTLTKGETDTSKEVEYTNWDNVKRFSQNFNEM